MEKKRRLLRLHFLITLAFLLIAPGFAEAAVVVWAGTATDVIDNDVNMVGPAPIVFGAGPTTVVAATTNVRMFLTGGNVTLESSASAESCLRLVAEPGHKITIDLTGAFDLTTLGSTDVALDPFVIFAQGEVDIIMAGGRTLRLGSDATHGASQFYVTMQNIPQTTVSFLRTDVAVPQTALDINIVIDPNSVLTYVAPLGDTTDNGIIDFCATNSGTGKMIVTINDRGSFVVAGHLFTPATETCNIVDRTTPSGNNAILNVTMNAACVTAFTGLTPHAFLSIVNKNTVYPELLVDPFFSQGAEGFPPFIGTFNGLRYGFVLGANGIVDVQDGTYLDYVGLTNNVCPPVIVEGIPSDTDELAALDCACSGTFTQAILKQRNASAFIVDGWLNPLAVPATITLGIQSGIFFRSGVDDDGVVENPTDPFIYTIDPDEMTSGAGEIVFDVEGPLLVNGSNVGDTYNSLMEILSLFVLPSGGPLFPEVGATGTTFPLRTFAVDSEGELYQYNKAAWLINNIMTVTDASIAHTDELHTVCQSNDVISEASYIGGEQWFLSELREDIPLIPRPSIQFINARLHLYTSAAFAGVDLVVPDNVIAGVEFPNLSKFVFYSNGRVVDNGTGRTLILGTLIGSQACDGCTIISRDAHLDVIQTTDFTAVDPSVITCQDQQLWFTASLNTNLTTEAIDNIDITGQTSIHEIYLGWNSNISIGEQEADCVSDFTFSSTPAAWIAGNFFNFSTRGGSVGIPETSNVTGQGGIFVDLNGRFGIFPPYRASIATMVTKSCSTNLPCGPQIILPKSQVVFANRVGITDWKLTMSGVETVIVPAGQVYSDYTLNWVSTIKDFAATDSSFGFIPYEIGNVNMCGCPPVIRENITSLPTVMGTVDQLQIVDSRIGDAASIMIDGGYVREMLWLSNCRPAEAPVAIVAIQNGGRLGFNTANRNVDSINTETTLGVNGVTIIANGNGRIDLNADMIVNNICPILQGPDWTSSDILEFRADASRAIHVTAGGILDLRSFTNGGIIRIGENIRLVFEPGSTLILGGVALELNENASIEWEASPQAAQFFLNLDATVGPINNALNPLVTYDITTPHPLFAPLINYGTGLHNTDPFRAHIYGVGTIRLRDRAQSFIGVGAVVGLETLRTTLPGPVVCTIPLTNLTLELDEGTSWQIGFGNNDEGGSFQIGNVQENSSEGQPHSINFTLKLNGPDATFVMGAGAFFGLGAGVVRPTAHDEPQSKALADTLFDVASITFNNIEGSFQVQRIFDSNDPRSQSLVIGNVTAFNLLFAGQGDDPVTLDTDNFGIYGGGNFFQLVSGTDVNDNLGAVFLINLLSDDVILIPVTGGPSVPDARLFASILASTDMLDNLNVSGLTPQQFFTTWKASTATVNADSRSFGYSTIAPLDPLAFRESRTSAVVGYIDNLFIGRVNISDITDVNGASQGDRRARAYDIGTVAIALDLRVATQPRPALTATQLQGS